MAQTSQFDIVIIGAGVLGCSISHALARRGYKTVNVDRLPAAGYGSTSYSSAIIRPFYSTIEATSLAYESHFCWQQWAKLLQLDLGSPLPRYVQCGCLILMPPGSNRLAKTRQILAAVGVPFEIVEPDKLVSFLPSVDIRSFGPPKRIDDAAFGEPSDSRLEGGLFCPSGGYISDPQLACRNLEQSSKAFGAQYRYNAEVVEILQASGRVRGIRFRDADVIEAPIIINVAGPHSSRINELAGLDGSMKIRTRAMRQEVVQMDFSAPVDVQRSVIADADCGVYMRPDVGNHALVGSLEPSCDPLDWVDPDHYQESLTEQSTNQLWRAAQRFPNLLLPNVARGSVGLYDVSSDWFPIYDRSDLDGYFMAIGTSGNQFKNAPIIGDLMAGLIDYCQQGGDHDADPYHYRLKHLDRFINVGAFSRNRSISEASSFSVLG